MAQPPLQFHVEFNLIKRDVTGSLDHHLHTLPPSPFGQFTQRHQFGQLSLIGGIGESPGTKAVSDGKGHVVLAHDVANRFPMLVHRILFAVNQHPFCEE